jgi:hypothetical protein
MKTMNVSPRMVPVAMAVITFISYPSSARSEQNPSFEEPGGLPCQDPPCNPPSGPPEPEYHGGGNYRGPGDTVPPGTSGPSGGCVRGLAACAVNVGPTLFPGGAVGFGPSCLVGTPIFVSEITVGDLLDACEIGDGSVCVGGCGSGFQYCVYTYQTSWFRYDANGINNSHPNPQPPYGGVPFSSYCEGVRVDCARLVDVLDEYENDGWYHPGWAPLSILDDDSVVFAFAYACGPSPPPDVEFK